MERHPELIREIASQVAVRSTNTDDPAPIDENIGDFTQRKVYGHVRMYQHAGLFRTVQGSDGKIRWDVMIGLTWKGYDELVRLMSR